MFDEVVTGSPSQSLREHINQKAAVENFFQTYKINGKSFNQQTSEFEKNAEIGFDSIADFKNAFDLFKDTIGSTQKNIIERAILDLYDVSVAAVKNALKDAKEFLPMDQRDNYVTQVDRDIKDFLSVKNNYLYQSNSQVKNTVDLVILKAKIQIKDVIFVEVNKIKNAIHKVILSDRNNFKSRLDDVKITLNKDLAMKLQAAVDASAKSVVSPTDSPKDKRALLKAILLASDFYYDLQFLSQVDENSDVIKASMQANDSIEEKINLLSPQVKARLDSSLVDNYYDVKKDIQNIIDKIE